MDYLTLGILGFSALFLVFGLLLGLIAGFKRSILNLVLTVVALAVAFFARNTIVGIIKGINIKGKTVNDYILGIADSNEKLQGVMNNVTPLVDALLSVIVYFLSSLILLFVFRVIIYPIAKIFVRKGMERKRLLGALVGLIAGIVCCVFVVAPISNLVADASKIVVSAKDNLPDDIIEDVGLSEDSSLLEDLGLETYGESAIGGVYHAVGGWVYGAVTTVKDGDNKTNLPKQMRTFEGVVKVAGKMLAVVNDISSSTSDMDIEKMMEDGDFSSLKEAMRSIDSVIGELDNEQKESISSMLSDVADSLVGDDMNIDLKNFDLTEVKLEKEVEIIEDLYTIKDKTEKQETLSQKDVDKVVKNLSESKLILPIIEDSLESMAGDLSGNSEMIQTALNGVENAEVKARLEKLLLGDKSE